MDKLQKARLDLFNLMHGQIIPNSIMADICYVVDGKKFDKFKEIYQDPKKKYLLVVNDTTSEGYLEFWKELFPDEELCSKAVEFLQGRDFLEVKFSWKEELANFIRNEANSQTNTVEEEATNKEAENKIEETNTVGGIGGAVTNEVVEDEGEKKEEKKSQVELDIEYVKEN